VESGLTISRINLCSRLSIPEPVFPSACGYLKTYIAHVGAHPGFDALSPVPARSPDAGRSMW
jgi:hypothetical protein